MSHFTVLVRIRPGEDLEALLAPYQENNMGDCPEKYLAFEDMTEELREEFAEKMLDVFVDPAGKPHLKYSHQFQHNPPGRLGISSETRYLCPEGWTSKEIPVAEMYTFERFVEEYHGYNRKDEGVDAWGLWKNPNAKWDWWTVGGRWDGWLGGENERPSSWFKENHQRNQSVAQDKLAEFCASYEKARAAGALDDDPFADTPRSRALGLGLIECCDADSLPNLPGDVLIKWRRQLRDGVDRFDVLHALPEDASALWPDFYPVTTYAYLDSSIGWKEPGRMGWWASTDETPDTRRRFKAALVDLILSAAADDTFVVVDCHI